MVLDDREKAILAPLEGANAGMEALLGRLVEQNSFSQNRDGVNAVGAILEEELRGLGFRVAELVTGSLGRTLIARRAGAESHRLLLLGHLDTVHPPESAFRGLKPLGDGDKATGPGAADMKGGLVILVHALRALSAAGALEGRKITVVLNADEEVGSPSSADMIRSEAMDSDLCLALEAGRPIAGGGSTFVTARKGFGRARIVARGRASHAGVAPGEGASAILELAHKVIALDALNEPERQISVNVGTFHGGTAANTIPDTAEIELDYRFPDEDTGLELEEHLASLVQRRALRTADGRPSVAVVMKDQVKRPPLVRTDAIARMAGRIVAAGQDLGLRLEEEARGGSSDAALAAEVGCPALCGLGAVGDAFHTATEWVHLPSLVDRARLLALVMDRFFRGEGAPAGPERP